MGAVHFTDGDFNEKVLKSDKPVMVDFFADWCGPCQAAAPIIDELADSEKDKITIGKLNVDENQQTAVQFGVMSIPTVIVFRGGKEADRKVGFGGREGYEMLIKKALS